MTVRPICWSRPEIQLATQVDVGGLEVGDPIADAVFLAIHQAVPIGRLRKAGDEKTVSLVEETDVLTDFTRPLTTNEPHLVFVTGRAGTGKSHLVRWLRSRIGERPDWHVIYVEKRNTSLRRIIEQILVGIDSPRARELKEILAQVESEIGSVGEAMLALLQKLEQLVRFDPAPSVGDLSGATLIDLREKAGRLIGDYSFREQLSRPGGPVKRITELAMTGGDPGADIDEGDLHLSSEDLSVEPEDFLDTGAALQSLVKLVVSNGALRRDLALLLDHYLARAKAEVFTGKTTDLLEVFEEVRREVAARGQDLCLFIEDLVLLHGIDTELAQALTIPARKDLCRLRAVIAVTSGYLRDVTTFAERGVHYTMNVERESVDADALRAFVARYLNAGRVGGAGLAAANDEGSLSLTVPNKCSTCDFLQPCHATFGASSSGHGLYPFNGVALDRLIGLASPTGFDPRTILREVVRAPLEVAEDELPTAGRFPSERFAASLDPHRSGVRVEDRHAITSASANPQQELGLRAFYATSPPAIDDAVRLAADYFDVHLSEVEVGEPATDDAPVDTEAPKTSPIDAWATGTRLPAEVAHKIRGWVLATITARLQAGPFGVPVRKTKLGEWQVGQTFLHLGDVVIGNAGGGGGVEGKVALRFAPSDADAVILKGVLAATSGNRLAGPDNGQWYLALDRRLAEFEASIMQAAGRSLPSEATSALAILGVQRNLAGPSASDLGTGLPTLLRPVPSTGLHPAAAALATDTKNARDRALKILRDQCTQSKGDGAPSVFDAGPLLKDIRHSIGLEQLKEPFTGSDELVQAMKHLNQRQQAAAQAIWSEVRALVQQVGNVLPPDEDLAAGMDGMDKLVEAAHSRGQLPSQDARTDYLERRRAVDNGAIALYRTLSARAKDPVEPQSLWKVAVDPTPSLGGLHSFVVVAQKLLHFIENELTSLDDGAHSGDRDRLDQAFRGLADRLDVLEKAK